VKAYQQAVSFVQSQPRSARAHHVLSYVLRYGGLLDESAHECETAMTLDPGEYVLRACSTTFSEMGNPQRAMDFLQTDAGSDWVRRNSVRVLLREGKLAEARQALEKLPYNNADNVGMMKPCVERALSGQPISPELQRNMQAREPESEANPDPENRYFDAVDMAFCGAKEPAVRLLKSAIAKNYCAYDALQKDPLLAPLRSMPEYQELLSAAKQCRDKFLAERNQPQR
jgi:hypothetical protein